MSEPIHLLSRSTIGLVGLFKQLTPVAVIRQQQLRTRRRTLHVLLLRNMLLLLLLSYGYGLGRLGRKQSCQNCMAEFI